MSDTFAEPGRPAPPPTPRAVLVVGSGRSGANDLARALQLLGLRAPSGATRADRTSPTPAESLWVTRFHERLLRRANITVADARPQAWFETGKLATDEEVRQELFDWLAAESAGVPSEMVIADPRLAWFLSLWKAASRRCGVEASYAVMLRTPGEVIGSTPRQGTAHASETSRAAGWINHALHTERATRGSRRAFVIHEDLFEDWTVPLYRLGERFGLDSVHNATAREIRQVHDLIKSRSSTPRTPWVDADIPGPLKTMIDEAWDQLTKLAGADDEPTDVHTTLDELRREYAQLYADAERIAHSTVVAARRRKPSRRTDAPASGSEIPPETPPRRRLSVRRWRA